MDVGLPGHYFLWMSRHCFRVSRAVITVSAAVHAEALSRFPQIKAMVRTVHHGVEASSARAVQSDCPATILYVAKLMPYKGQMEALKAFEVLFDMAPDLGGHVKLVFHGFSNDADYAARLQKAAAEQNSFVQAVEFRAYEKNKSLDEIYCDADLVLFLSRHEGFGFPVVEAQARGIPVICSDIQVLHEIGGDGALYVDRRNPFEVATALLKLIRYKSARERLAAAGLENVQRFSWDTAAKETLKVYKEILK